MSEGDLHRSLQSLAYELWVKRGRPIGTPEIDWAAAERMCEEPSTQVSSEDITVVNSSLTRVDASSDEGNASSARLSDQDRDNDFPSQTAAPSRRKGAFKSEGSRGKK